MKPRAVYALGAVSVVSTVVSLVLLATRDGSPSPADPAIKPEPAPKLPAPEPGSRVKLVLPRGQKGINATLRAEPWGETVGGVKPGTEVTIEGFRDAPEKRGRRTVMRRWYEITTATEPDGAIVRGWMHGDLLPGAAAAGKARK